MISMHTAKLCTQMLVAAEAVYLAVCSDLLLTSPLTATEALEGIEVCTGSCTWAQAPAVHV